MEYDGDLLSNSDIPLEYKIQAIDFIVSDAKNNGNLTNSTINIYYDLIGEKYKLDDFGTDYPDFYNAPYTIGRIFDLILLKDFGIKNYQEGIQIRSTKDVNYIITYKFHTRVDVAKLSIKEYKDINRFRVFVIDN